MFFQTQHARSDARESRRNMFRFSKLAARSDTRESRTITLFFKTSCPLGHTRESNNHVFSKPAARSDTRQSRRIMFFQNQQPAQTHAESSTHVFFRPAAALGQPGAVEHFFVVAAASSSSSDSTAAVEPACFFKTSCPLDEKREIFQWFYKSVFCVQNQLPARTHGRVEQSCSLVLKPAARSEKRESRTNVFF